MSERSYWTNATGQSNEWLRRKRVSRRRLLGTSAGALAMWAAACSSTQNNKTSGGGANNSTKVTVPAAANNVPAASATAATSVARTTPAPPAVKKGGVLQGGTVGESIGLDPHAVTGVTTWVAYAGLFESLLRYNPKDLSAVPGLATKWEEVDQTSVIFTLRDGVQFHDGTAFNAEAAKYNVDRVLDPATKALDRASMSVITKTEATAPNTLKLTLKQPAASLLAMFGYRPGFMVSRDAAEKGTLNDKPVGSGPFRFVEWAKKDHLRFERFPNYWAKDSNGNQLPYLDGFLLKVLPDGEQQFNALATASTHLLEIGSVTGVGQQYIDRIKGDGNLAYQGGESLGFRSMVLNLAIPPLDNADLRRAMAYAVDRKAYVDAVQFGHATPAKGPASPRDWANDPSIAGYTYDPAKAKEYLAKGGQPNGFAFPGSVDTTPDLQQGAELLKAQLAKVGINFDYHVVDRVTNTQVVYDTGTTGATIGGNAGRVDFGQAVVDMFSGTGRYMIAGRREEWKPDPEIERLIQQGEQTYKQEERSKIYSDLEKRVVDNVYGHLLVSYPELGFGMRKSVHNFVWVADNYPRLHEVWMD
jgi:peptide/nickel transport system substrate-binding protein